MDAKDKNYLRLQFWNKVYQKNATEFQSFFEDIMQRAFSDFKKIRPYGNQGDGGNDGYRPNTGTYYQVYAPKNPSEKDAEAAIKLQKDFENLKTNWENISKVKEYNFVFNDKNTGSTIEIERALAQLQVSNKKIVFKRFVPIDLEEIFFTLPNDQILSLGFDIDSTKTLKIARDYIEKLEIELDRDNSKFVFKTLKNLKDIISTLNNDDLLVDFEIIEARTLQRLEKVKEAKEKYEKLIKRYPADSRAYLYLAEIYVSNEDFKKNEDLLKSVESFNKDSWLLLLQRLIRNYRLNSKLDTSKINDKDFPSNPRIKSSFYRIYAGFIEESGDKTKSDSFIEKAIHLNPNKFNNYDAKLSIIEGRIYEFAEDRGKLQKMAQSFLQDINNIEELTSEWGELGPRNRAIISFRKFNAYRMLEDLPNIEKFAKEGFDLIIQCYFDQLVDHILVGLLTFVELPPKDFDTLLKYFESVEKKISDDLAKRMVFQFNLKDQLFTEGKLFFKKIGKKNISEFISNLENGKHDEVLKFLSGDSLFAVAIANTAKKFPELRLKIIESLPSDGKIQKEKLLLLLDYDKGDIDGAFKILKRLDLSNLGCLESRQILKIAQQKKAWDFVIVLLENLLKHEVDPQISLRLKLQLFTANFNIDRYKEAAILGEKILSTKKEIALLDEQNRESLLGQSILARLKRGEFVEAKKVLERNLKLFKTFEFILGVKTDVYIKNNDAIKAIASIVEGIKLIKNPTPEQYGRLFIFFTEIGNMIDFSLSPDEKIIVNSFVKVKNTDRWYFIGDSNELDATKINADDERYVLFLNKKVGDEIKVANKYQSSESIYSIENILPIEKYILWQCKYNVEKLTSEKRWNAMEMIEVPSTGDSVDPKYIIARLEDDKKSRGEFFDLYCQKNLPLAFLAINQGSLTGAIGCIVNENRGYIKFSSGDLEEINKQKDVAQKIIDGGTFYIDSTSALVLSETGLLKKIYEYVPNLKVPQSVITFLLDIKDKFRFVPGHVGHMAYVQGNLRLSDVNEEKRTKIHKNFSESITLLESTPKNIAVISAANKHSSFLEQKVDPSLCDACILAQENGDIVLTEDFLYLKANEMETKKAAPEYTSAFAVVRLLYEKHKLTFEEYISFFSYLASYRFRFLPLTTEDIEKAITGDGPIKVIKPENIHLFNFPLTLSEDYGVPFDIAFNVVVRFLIKILIDDSILPEVAEKIFIEILSDFPTDKSKKELGQMFLRVSAQVIKNLRQKIIIGVKIQEKLDASARYLEICDRKEIYLP